MLYHERFVAFRLHVQGNHQCQNCRQKPTWAIALQR